MRRQKSLYHLQFCSILTLLWTTCRRRHWRPTPVLLPAVHGIAKSQTGLSNFIFTFHFHALEKEMATHSSVLAWRIPGTGEPGGRALYGVAQSQTQLMWLSSSSSMNHLYLKKRQKYCICDLHLFDRLYIVEFYEFHLDKINVNLFSLKKYQKMFRKGTHHFGLE